MKVKEILPLTATGIITNYETALFNSLSQSYPNVRISGYHDQAVYKTGILKNDLSNLYSSNQEFRKRAELLLFLSLLPSNKIVDMYHHPWPTKYTARYVPEKAKKEEGQFVFGIFRQTILVYIQILGYSAMGNI